MTARAIAARRRASPPTLAEDRVCPACRSALGAEGEGLVCASCGRAFPSVAGLVDLRLRPDRYLPLDAERTKARRLGHLGRSTDFSGLVAAYYAMTEDVDVRRGGLYRAHAGRSEARGEALLGLLPDRGRVLEVGCGTGGLLLAARRKGLAIEGVDIASRWLVAAAKRLDEGGVRARLTVANGEHLPWPDGTFDAVVADSVLEHLDDPGAALREWLRATRPGGRLVLVSPNRRSLLPDPHVGLWGLGFLPRRWQGAYVRLRRGCSWPVVPRTAREADRLVASAGWSLRSVEAAPWPLARGGAIRHLYEKGLRVPFTRRFLAAFGPLWTVTATREGRS